MSGRAGSCSRASTRTEAFDETFGTNGGVQVAMGAQDARLTGIVMDDDGQAVLVGHRFDGLLVARVTPEGAFDDTLGRLITMRSGSGDVTSPYAGSGGVSTAAFIQPDGKLVVAGRRQLVSINGMVRTSSFLLRFHMEDDGTPSPVAVGPAGVLSVTGTGGNDLLDATEETGIVYAHRNTIGRAFDLADVQRVAITGGDGNDRSVAELLTIPVSVVGGLGSDRISGGQRGDTLEGSGDRDFIDGGGSNDSINGGSGNDAIRGQDGDDTIEGAAGDDEIHGGAGVDVRDGGPGNDVEVDIDLPDVWLAEDGMLRFVDSGDDDDKISLWADGAGGLVVWVDGVTDTIDLALVTEIRLEGNGGSNLLKLNPGLNVQSTLRGGSGRDTIIGGANLDEIYGGAGDDLLIGNADVDPIRGEDGNDVLRGGAGTDYLDGAAGNDRIDGGIDNDTLIGGAGRDVLFGGLGADNLVGLAGNDVLLAVDGVADTVNGGLGTDTGDVDDADEVLALESVA